MSIKVTGLSELLGQLKKLDTELGEKALASAGRLSFKSVLEAARALVPVDSGELRDAIRIRVAKSKNGGVAVGIQIASSTSKMKQARVAAAAFNESQSKRLPPSRRWHFVELGTANQAPKPFLRPALDQNAQRVVDDLREQLKKQIAKVAK